MVWFDDGNGNYDIRGRSVSPDGTLGDGYTISQESQNERHPRLALDGSGGALVVWERDNSGTDGYDLYGRRLGTDGQPVGDPDLILETDEDQQKPVAAGDGTGRYLLAWQDNRNGNWDVYASLYESADVPALITRTLHYVYDPLNRLTAATYSTGESYTYTYDAVGNRAAMTATHESRTTQYEYDAANRLTSVDDVTYTWDERGNLVSDGTFTYAYDAAGRMVQAESVG
ncbi:MAG: hypothetical protein GY851_15480, partial [bacterium]|nr:hypothetical protein [bacterium]